MCVEFAYTCMSDQVHKSIMQSTEIKMNCHYSENVKFVHRYHIKWKMFLLCVVIRMHVCFNFKVMN